MPQDDQGPAAIRFQGALSDRAREIIEGSQSPAVPRDAATVMLLRPAPASAQAQAPVAAAAPAAPVPAAAAPAAPVPAAAAPAAPVPAAPVPAAAVPAAAAASGLEVYMLRRQPTMAFAPGAFVFPGGAVDARDADEQVAWAGPDAAVWGRIFEAPPDLARALVCAAVRETFEESGVLLAGPSADTVVADTTGPDWEADRVALVDRSLSLAGLLARRKLVLRADLLRPWSRWITPSVEPRRYDARFFAAALPRGQRTRDVGGEAASVTWTGPADALAAGRRGEIALWPPTAVTLAELAACGDVPTALDGPREVVPRIPEVLIKEGAVWLTVPGVQEYPL